MTLSTIAERREVYERTLALLEDGARLLPDKASFLASVAPGALIAILSRPFGNDTAFEIVGDAPPQLVLANGGRILAGNGAIEADASYAIKVRARSADAKREVAETLSFVARGATLPIPRPTLTATPSFVTITTASAAGTLIATIGNIPNGASIAVVPNDGRLAITGDRIVIGLSASGVGTTQYTVSAPGANPVVLTVTVEAVAPVSDAITSDRGANTLAGHGSVNLGALLPEPMVATSSTYTPVSGTSAHWTLPTNGGHPVPSAAGVTAVLNGGPYVFDYTISDGTRTVSERLTINAVTSWTPDAEVVNDPWMVPLLAAEPLITGTTRYFTCINNIELTAIRAAATANGAVIFIPRGLTTRPSLLLNAWETAAGKWAIITDEDRRLEHRSRLSRLYAQNGTMDRLAVFGTRSDRSVAKDGGTFSTGAYQFGGVARVILADLYHDTESSVPQDTVDAVRVVRNSVWTYISGDFRRFASIEHSGGELIGGAIYSTGCFNNTIITGSTGTDPEAGAIRIRKLVHAGSDMLGSAFQGWHQDALQIRDFSRLIPLVHIDECVIMTSPRYSVQGLFGEWANVQRIEIENLFYQGRARNAIRPSNTAANGYIRFCTIVPEPDAVTKDVSDYPGSTPSIDFGATGTSTCAVEDSFVVGFLVTHPSQTTARNTVLSVNRNADLSSYFAEPIGVANKPAEYMSAKQLEPVFRAAYAPRPTLLNPDGTYRGAFMPDGSRNIGMAA